MVLFLPSARTWHFPLLNFIKSILKFIYLFFQEKLDQGIRGVPSEPLFSNFDVSPSLPTFQPAEVPLSDSTLIWSVSHDWFSVLFKPAEGVWG